MKAGNHFDLEHLKSLITEIPERDRFGEMGYRRMLEVMLDGFLGELERKNSLYYFDGRNIRIVGTTLTVKIAINDDGKGNMEQVSFRSRLSWIAPEKDPAKKVARLFKNYVRRCDSGKLMSSVEEIFGSI